MRQLFLVLPLGSLFACASCPAPAPTVEKTASPPTASPPTAAADSNALTGWFLAGSGPGHYRAERDAAMKHDGRASARLRSVEDPGGKFATIMQSIRADDYVGKRVRLSGFVRTADVRDWSGLWLRVDRKGGQMTLDNMQNRPIRGTTDWNAYSVVLDVPPDTESLHFGVLQTGAGTTWLDDVRLESVDATVPTTNGDVLLPRPANLTLDD
jgi:hypothetical protein